MEKQTVKKVFVKLNQKWENGEIESEQDNTVQVKLSDGQSLAIERGSSYMEEKKRPAQQYAYGDLKEKLEGQYVSYTKLTDNIKDQLVEGREYLHESTYVKEGKLKESVKMVQMGYNRNSGSVLNVQIKRNVPIKQEDAVAYNHKFTPGEFDKMVNKGKAIVFEGNSNDGEVFKKLAYYEPKLNDLRVKRALSENDYFYGKKLTSGQAESLNNGKEIKMTISSKTKGDKEYMVSYSPRSESFKTKSVEKMLAQKQQEKENLAEKLDNKPEKKKSRSRGMKV